MSRQADKGLLLFNTGEVTPLLAGRTDVERITGGCRTLENMLVELSGPVTRRPGTQFVAEAKAAGPGLSFVSYEGSARYYGTTEFASLSDPPRKYLDLYPAPISWRRSYDSPSTWYNDILTAGARRFNTSGSIVQDLGIIQTRPGATSEFSVTSGTNAGLAGGPGGLYTDDTGRDDFEDNDPIVTLTRLTRQMDSFGTAHTTEAAPVFRLGATDVCASAQRRGIVEFTTPSLSGGVWTTNLTVRDHGAQAGNLRTRISSVIGNAMPADPEVSGSTLINSSSNATVVLKIPAGTSIRLHVSQTSGALAEGYFPRVINEDEQELAGCPLWIYFPESGPIDLDYYEFLGNEDTLLAAIQRGSGYSVGTDETSSTTSVTGGITAGSETPIDWTGRFVLVSKTFTGLTIGHRYTVSAVVRTNTIGGSDFINSTVSAGTFIAVGTSQVFTWEMRAPNGFERRALSMSATDAGAVEVGEEIDGDVLLWWGRVLSNGGTITGNSLDLADGLVSDLKAANLWDNLVYILALLGDDLAAAVVPLRDEFEQGNATNNGFAEADFDETNGLQSNGSSKYFQLPITSTDIGSAYGVGYRELQATAGADTTPFCFAYGGASGSIVGLTNHEEPGRRFRAGASANAAVQAAGTGAGHFYGHRGSATSRILYVNGVSVATNTTNDAAADVRDWRLMGRQEANAGGAALYYNGLCGLAYLTDGTIDSTEAATLHTIVEAFMTATGRT